MMWFKKIIRRRRRAELYSLLAERKVLSQFVCADSHMFYLTRRNEARIAKLEFLLRDTENE